MDKIINEEALVKEMIEGIANYKNIDIEEAEKYITEDYIFITMDAMLEAAAKIIVKRLQGEKDE